MFELSFHQTEYFKHKIFTVTQRKLHPEDTNTKRVEIYTPSVDGLTTMEKYFKLFDYAREFVGDMLGECMVRYKPTRLLIKQKDRIGAIAISDKEADHIVQHENAVVCTFDPAEPMRVVNELSDYRYLLLQEAGRVVLLPKTKRGHVMYRNGQVARLVKFGMNEREAVMYYKLGKHVPYYLEPIVVDWYVKEASGNWTPYLEEPENLWDWVRDNGYNRKMKERGFTIKRLATVLAMVKLLHARLNQ